MRTCTHENSTRRPANTNASDRVADSVELTDTFRIRFIASDLGEASVVEAGIDAVRLFACPSTAAEK